MLLTSAEANKLLKKLRTDCETIERTEKASCTFLASVGEDAEAIRPEYDFAATQTAIREINEKICRLKHAINTFNLTHKVDGFDRTVDEMLVYIPQLTARYSKLSEMKGRLPRERETEEYRRIYGNVIDYRYTNYNVKEAAAECDRTLEELSRAQNALDLLNSTVKFEVDI